MKKLLSTILLLLVTFFSLFVSCNENENEELNRCKVTVDCVGKGIVKISKYLETTEFVLRDSEIEVVALPNDGYAFIGWYMDGVAEPVSIDATFTFIATKDITLTARFIELFNFGIHSAGNGSVALKGFSDTSMILQSGSEITVVATPDEYCVFLGWYVDDAEEPISTDAEYTYTVIEDMTLTARFYPMSYITIGAEMDSIYYTCKTDTLVIKPIITQTNTKPLSYTWEVNYQPFSNDEAFEFVADEIGRFECCLTVENADDKQSFPFVINVLPDYRYGMTVLSQDANGNSMLSFMPEPVQAGDAAQFTDYECFAHSNPNVDFAANAVVMVQCGGNYIIACQGGGERNDTPTIYYLNEKTMVAERILPVTGYDDFKPTALGVPSITTSYDGVNYPILCENGKVYDFYINEGTVSRSYKLQYTYAQTCFIESENSYYYNFILWDKEVNDFALIYNGYGPYYCGDKYLLERDSLATDSYYIKNFINLKGVKNITLIRRTPEQKETQNGEFIAIVEARLALQKVVMPTFFWGLNENMNEPTLINNNGFVKAASKSFSLIDENTPSIANATYKTMFFPDRNKVMRWYYDKKNNYYLENSDVLLQVGSDNAVITGFEMSLDHKITYVSFYDPQQDGQNGSVWAFDTDTGEVLERYDNICYRPVKMLLKSR